MERISAEWRAVLVFPEFRPVFVLKRAEIFEFFEHVTLRTAFLNIHAFFYERNWTSICLFFSCIGNVVTGRGWSFRRPKNSRRRVFGENNWKPRFFPRAIVTLFNFSGLSSHVWHRNAGYAIEYEALVDFSISPNFSWFSPQHSGRNFSVEESEFSNKFQLRLKLSPFTMPHSDAYHLNCGTVWALCVAMSLIQVSTMTYFLSCVLSEIVKKWVSLNFVDCSKNFLSSCTNDKSELV